MPKDEKTYKDICVHQRKAVRSVGMSAKCIREKQNVNEWKGINRVKQRHVSFYTHWSKLMWIYSVNHVVVNLKCVSVEGRIFLNNNFEITTENLKMETGAIGFEYFIRNLPFSDWKFVRFQHRRANWWKLNWTKRLTVWLSGEHQDSLVLNQIKSRWLV